jgi:hypothetical protein
MPSALYRNWITEHHQISYYIWRISIRYAISINNVCSNVDKNFYVYQQMEQILSNNYIYENRFMWFVLTEWKNKNENSHEVSQMS